MNKTQNSNVGSASFGPAYIQLTRTGTSGDFGGKVCTANQIDLTGYSQMCVVYADSPTTRVQFGASQSNSIVSSGDLNAETLTMPGAGAGTYALDISALSGSYYIWLCSIGVTSGSAKISAVYLI